MNILVGENEAGKSTILEALHIVLNQQYKNADKAILRDLFNSENVANFKANPSIDSLPSIIIEVDLELDARKKDSEYFHGEVYGQRIKQAEQFGIRFECKFDNELGVGLEGFILEGNIPFEYYTMNWVTYANRPYQLVKRPIKFISIDTSSTAPSASFNYYNRTLFTSVYDDGQRAQAKNTFRQKLDTVFESLELSDIDSNRRFGIDSKKVVLESIISVYEDSISLENRGSGMESLIKTQIALEKKTGLDVILIEEPENHLCFSNLKKMLTEISKQKDNTQLIVSTHSNMIASGLNLNNVIWITENHVISLNDVSEEDANFFRRADNNSFLQLLLSKKAFLVEGPTEFLLIPYFYEKITGRTIEEDEITVISCNGISYKRYLSIAKATNKTVAVITDNDQSAKKITEASDFNKNNIAQHVFMADDVQEWTWEVCIYNANKEKLDTFITIDNDAEYKFHGKDYGKIVGKMLNNKVDTAFSMLTSGMIFEAPEYIKEAILWIRK